MVLAGLSLLALAFVSVSETESKISANERNGLQTQAIAEAGARAVVEWFQEPAWAQNLGLMPANSNTLVPAGFKRVRTIGAYSNVYKPLATTKLFDLPFRPAPDNRFYGDDDTADIQLDYTNSATTMAALNAFLFGADSKAAGHIAEIKVYAPPILGGTRTNGFWVGGQRFGTATIKVTAEMWSRDSGGTLLSSQVVRIVVGEFPLPIPAGPIQTASNAAFGGNFHVHWGDEVALGDLNPARNSTRIPWQNAFERPSFERGYDDVTWPRNDPPDLIPGNDIPNYLYELAGKSFEDPWMGARARGNVTTCGACGTYNQTSVEGQPIYAAFQGQTNTVFPTKRAVTFPTIDYNIWKRIALQGRGTKGVYYFTWDSGSNFKRNGQGPAEPVTYWVNVRGPGSRLGPGFYFFDTRLRTSPQLTGGATNLGLLTPGDTFNAGDFGGDFLMSGFIYLNMEDFGTTGVGSSPVATPVNMPGEIYRDIGYRDFNTGTGNWTTDAAGNRVMKGAGDAQWSFEDINGNGRFDVVVKATADSVQSLDPGTSPARSVFFLKTWDVGCTVATCTEPHEPYLNFIYPTDKDGNVQVGWEDPATQTRRPRDMEGNTVPDCATQPDLCTSNGYDRDGALVTIPLTLNGVLYNEGNFTSHGNVDYFGSILVRGPADVNGDPNVWFDEKLVKDNWAPAGMPRVIVYNSETDEQ